MSRKAHRPRWEDLLVLNTATTASSVSGLACFLLSRKIPRRSLPHSTSPCLFSPCESSQVVSDLIHTPSSPLLSSSSPYHFSSSSTGHILFHAFDHSSGSHQFVAPSLIECSTKPPSTLSHTSTSLSISLSFTPATHHHHYHHHHHHITSLI